MSAAPVYMACIDLKDRPCLVVGAGAVGLEKIAGLLECGAKVTVVAPDAVPEVVRLHDDGAIRWLRRPYRQGDLDRRFLAIAATADGSVNRRVFQDAEERSMLVNVVDVPELCSFILPAVVRQGPIAVAVSTSGASPVLAQRLRDQVRVWLGPEHARLAEVLRELRVWAKENLATYDLRKAFFESIVHGRPDPLELIRRGDETALRSQIADAQRRAVRREPAR
ncbi:MAG: bifunctional precorrin-2 dehydrogenase/sirohydrochlorin ferrochelatase [Actinomycetota bacterium]